MVALTPRKGTFSIPIARCSLSPGSVASCMSILTLQAPGDCLLRLGPAVDVARTGWRQTLGWIGACDKAATRARVIVIFLHTSQVSSFTASKVHSWLPAKGVEGLRTGGKRILIASPYKSSAGWSIRFGIDVLVQRVVLASPAFSYVLVLAGRYPELKVVWRRPRYHKDIKGLPPSSVHTSSPISPPSDISNLLLLLLVPTLVVSCCL